MDLFQGVGEGGGVGVGGVFTSPPGTGRFIVVVCFLY